MIMVFMIWREMCGNGVLIDIMKIITKKALLKTPKVLIMLLIVSGVVVVGVILPEACAVLIDFATLRLLQPVLWVFVVLNLYSSYSFLICFLKILFVEERAFRVIPYKNGQVPFITPKIRVEFNSVVYLF